MGGGNCNCKGEQQPDGRKECVLLQHVPGRWWITVLVESPGENRAFYGVWVTNGRPGVTGWTGILSPSTFLVYLPVVLFAVFVLVDADDDG